MSNLDSVFNTFQSGANAYSNRFTDHSYNVANAGTVAGKKRNSYLSTLNSIVTPTTFSPAGVNYLPTIDIETIGGVTPTTYTTNFMINAKKLCIVNQSADDVSPGQYGFTKVGTFYIDKDGNAVNHVGQFLKVVMTDSDGNPLVPNMATFDQLSTLNLKHSVGLPQSTSFLSSYAGLKSNAQVGDVNSQAKIVFDAKGNEYNVVFNYEKVATLGTDPLNTERWRVSAVATTNERPPQNVVINAAWANGAQVLFRNGVPVQYDDGVGPNPTMFASTVNPGGPFVAMPQLTLTPPATTAANPVNITVNLGTLGQSDGLTTLGGAHFNNNDLGGDGKGPGEFEGFAWDTAGRGIISYTNGDTQIVCRLPLITFKSMNSLTEGSGGIFYASDAAGPYTISFANDGDIRPSAVESSTASATDTYVSMAQDGKRFNACIGGLGKTISMLDVLEQLLRNA